MALVDFRHRSTVPDSPIKGYFYWVENDSVGTQIWFAPDTDKNHLILLNGEMTQSVQDLMTRIETLENSLADYAKTSDIPVIPENVSVFKNDAGYLTEHQSLADYAKTSDIPAVPENVSAFNNDAGYLTEHQSLEGYAKKSDIPTKVSELNQDVDYLTDSDLDDYARKSDIPEVPENVSELANDAGYLTVSDLDDYAKKSDIPDDYLTDSDMDKYVTEEELNEAIFGSDFDLKGYAKEEWVEGQGYVKQADLDGYVKFSDLEDSDSDDYVSQDEFDGKVAELEEKIESKGAVLKWTVI